MPKPIIKTLRKDTVIFWQQGSEDCSIGEPAICVEVFSDCICITQNDQDINLNYDTIPDLVKHLNMLYREHLREKKPV